MKLGVRWAKTSVVAKPSGASNIGVSGANTLRMIVAVLRFTGLRSRGSFLTQYPHTLS